VECDEKISKSQKNKRRKKKQLKKMAHLLSRLKPPQTESKGFSPRLTANPTQPIFEKEICLSSFFPKTTWAVGR
tara:strand:- start:1329 stop:1550 length:222 start_codon:yes stop_codon:yes gene_type:complete